MTDPPCRIDPQMPKTICGTTLPLRPMLIGRWGLVAHWGAVVGVLLLSLPARAADAGSLPPKLDSAVVRGLNFLEKQQGSDGAFEADGPRLATTGLGLMAFLGAGHEPDVGRYGLVVRQAVDFLVAKAPDDGYFGKVDSSRMYGHGIVTLALAEAYGVEPDPQRRVKLYAVLKRAVKVILDAQAVKKPQPQQGGWRYEPGAADSDLSLTGWNALALRAAGGAGLDVPEGATDAAVAFVLRCWRADQKRFAYQPGGEGLPAMTAVAILSLTLLDAGSRPEVAQAAKSLAERPIDDRFPYYSQYYATQAAHQLDAAAADGAGRGAWNGVARPILERLTNTQQDDGGWPQSNAQEPGRVYATGMALLTLTVPYQLLPVYQR
jgi:hypothetical protein